MSGKSKARIVYVALSVACGLFALAVAIAIRGNRNPAPQMTRNDPPRIMASGSVAINSVAASSPTHAVSLKQQANRPTQESSNSAPRSVVEHRGEKPGVSRPEDRGEDFSVLAQDDLLKLLSESSDRVELRKAAKVLGDRSIDGTLKLSEQESALLTNVVQKCLQQVMASDSNIRSEARDQIQRFWWAAAPALLKNMNSTHAAADETAIKSLILMRNESIIRSLMDTVEKSSDLRERARALFALGKMTERRESLIPGRTCMDRELSKATADKLIRPFLEGMQTTETNTAIRNRASQALRELDLTADRRLIPDTKKE